MAAIAFPSYAYNSAGQAAVVVLSQAAFNALPLPGTWAFTPYPAPAPTGVPFDPGFPDTDTRLQQMLIEARIQTMMLAQGLSITEDPQTQLRADVLANDATLAS